MLEPVSLNVAWFFSTAMTKLRGELIAHHLFEW